MDETKERDPIPEFNTLADIAEFWDSHSTADYGDLTHDVQFDVKLRESRADYEAVKLVPELGETLQALAQARGVTVETLVNVWLTEKVLEQV
jgi:CopG antitoxin of type II toxin-antitoxin system